jgi:hypothetical protein
MKSDSEFHAVFGNAIESIFETSTVENASPM